MAVVPMQKVAVICARDRADDVLRYLQGRGVLEISEGELPKEYKLADGKGSTLERAEVEAAYQKAELEFAVRALLPYAPDRVKNQQIPTEHKVIEEAAISGEFRFVVDRVNEIEEALVRLDRREQALHQEADMLRQWKHYSYRGNPFANVRTVECILGTMPESALSALDNELQKKKMRVDMERQQHDGTAYVVAYVWRDHTNMFREAAARHEWNDADITLPERHTPKERLAIIKRELDEVERERNDLRREMRSLARRLPLLRKAHRYFVWLEDEQLALERVAFSRSVAVLFGWVPKAEVDDLRQGLSRRVAVSDVLPVNPGEDEEPPVHLKLPALLRPFQSVTRLYGLPKPNEFDPTALLAPFFILFFALCLTDAGYGLVLAAIFGGVLFRTRKTISESPLVWLLFFSGIVTILVGIPFGGWFGLTPDRVPDMVTVAGPDGQQRFVGQVWNLSTTAGVEFLQNLAVVLGIIHLSFGMFLAGLHKWVHGDKIAALWKDFTSHLLIGTAILAYAAPEQWRTEALWAVAGALVLFVWGKGYGQAWYLRPVVGFVGLLNFSMSMLSNLISYLRLLALGLVTGAIALAVNEMSVEVGALLPIWLAIPVSVAIFLIGHTMSIALNTLGSFVHSARLQFIEFFLQFFEGGGREFRPFRRALS